MKKLILSTSFTLLFFSTTIAAEATPSFSRQIEADCRTCHFMGNRSLNEFGRQFKNNAFNETKEMQRKRVEKSRQESSNQ